MKTYQPARVPDVLYTDGLCVENSWVPPAAWTDYGSRSEESRDAVAVCRLCPVLVKCREWADRANPRGVWGAKWRAG